MTLAELALRSLLVSGLVVVAASFMGLRPWRDRVVFLGALVLLALPVLAWLPRWEVPVFQSGGLAPSLANPEISGWGWGSILLGVWGIGSAIRLGIWGLAASRLRELIAEQGTGRAVEAPLRSAVNRLGKRLGLRRGPDRIRILDGLRSPAVTGLFRVQLLLPEDAPGWSPRRLDAVLLHELAHLRRGDLWRDFAFRWVEVLYWWNPLAWLLGRMHRRDREGHCDAMVLGTGHPPTDYARALLAVATRSPSGIGVGMSVESPSRLERRIAALFESRKPRTGLVLPLLSGLALMAMATPLLFMAPVDRAPEPIPPGDGEVSLRLLADPFPGNPGPSH